MVATFLRPNHLYEFAGGQFIISLKSRAAVCMPVSRLIAMNVHATGITAFD